MMKLIAAVALGGAVPAAAGAATLDASPALWVVEDQDTKIYLFGTLHALGRDKSWFNDEVKAAFEESDELVLEARLPDGAELQPLLRKYLTHGTDWGGRTLSSRLPADLKVKYDAYVRAAGVPEQTFERLEPWFASMTMPHYGSVKGGANMAQGADAVLSKAARRRGMKVGELEGMDYQLSLFDTMPEAQQVALLGQMLEDAEQADANEAPMEEAWAAGDTEGLATLFDASIGRDAPLYDLIFTSRNRRWAEWIDQRLAEPGTIFVAVGAGHLAGKGSVQQLLAQRGVAAYRLNGDTKPQLFAWAGQRP